MDGEATEEESDEDLDELSPDETKNEEDTETSSGEIDETPEIQTVQRRGKVFHQCPYPDCEFESEKLAALLGHIKFRHKTHGEYLTKEGKVIKGDKLVFDTPMNRDIAARTAAKSRSTSKSSASRGAPKMAKSSEEDGPVDIGLKSKVKGKLRRLLKLIAQADPEQRDILMPEREQIMDFVKILNKATTGIDDIVDIENQYEDEIKPTVESVLDISITKEQREKVKPPALSEEMAGLTRTAKLRGKVKMALTSLAKLPPSKKDELVAERETLVMLNRRLGAKEISHEELDEMEAVFESEVNPTLDAAIQATKKVPTKQKSGDSISSMTLAHKQEELEMARVNRLLTEEQVRESDLRESLRERHSGGGYGSTLVPIKRIQIDDKGQVVKDEQGRPVMEETYVPAQQAQSSNDLLVALLLSGKLGGGDQNNLLAIIMDNNTKLLTAMMTQGKGEKTDREIILEVQNQNMQMMMNMQKNMMETINAKKEDPQMNMLREEIRAARDAQQQTQNQMHQQQLAYMSREMDDLKRYAYRDDLESILSQKEKLEKLGIVNPAAKDAETKALEESTKLAKEAIDKVDDIGKEFRTFVQPFADAQAEIMRTQAGMNRPLRKAMTEQEKTKKYKQLLDAIEAEEEEQ